MKKLLLLFALVGVCQAATIGTVCPPPVSTVPPFTETCSLVWAGASSPVDLVSGIIVTSQPTGPIAITLGGVAVTANKTLATNGNTFIVYGRINNNLIGDGVLGSVNIPILAGTPPCSTGAACFTVSVANPVATNPSGNSVPTTASPSAAFTITGVTPPPPPPINACDINNDGTVNAADVDKAIANYLAKLPIFPAKIPTVLDAQAVLNSALGLPCSASVVTPPPPPPPPALLTLTGFFCAPQAISGAAGGNVTCTATLGSQAPAGGASVSISSTADILIPPTLLIPANAASGSFTFAIGAGFGPRPAPITATYNGVSKTAPFTVQ